MLLELTGLAAQKRESLAAMYRDLAVNCVVSNPSGTQADGLRIPNNVIALAVDAARCPMASFVKDPCFKRTLRVPRARRAGHLPRVPHGGHGRRDPVAHARERSAAAQGKGIIRRRKIC